MASRVEAYSLLDRLLQAARELEKAYAEYYQLKNEFLEIMNEKFPLPSKEEKNE